MANELPTLTITLANGVNITNVTKDNWTSGAIEIADPNTQQVLYSGALSIKGHGNGTWGPPGAKNPYKIKLAEKVSMLGMQPNKDWLLMANSFDPSLVATAMAMTVGQNTQALTWTPHFVFADVTFNTSYWGVYQIMEAVELATARLDLPGVDATTYGPTGTYLMEINNQNNSDNQRITATESGMTILFDDPKGPDATQKKYMQTFVDSFEPYLALSGGTVDPQYQMKVDSPSFAAWFLIEDFASNQDSEFFGSCRFFKTRQPAGSHGKIHMGPLWDFDISFGNVVNYPHNPDQHYTIPGAKWLAQLLTDATFLGVVKQQWALLKAANGPIGPNGANLIATMNTQLASIAASHTKDQQRWNNYIYNETDGGWSHQKSTYPSRADWIRARFAYFDGLYG